MYSLLPLIYLANLILNAVFNLVIGFVGLLTIPFILILGLGDFPN
ncbi:MAG: hypothetical protein ACJ0HV_00425 [Candidatus Pseudothioglobus sp.]